MKRPTNWDDFRLFFGGRAFREFASGRAPARRERADIEPPHGGLGAAVRPRPVRAHRAGLQIAETALELVTLAEEMETTGMAVERWRDGKLRRQVVKISAGTWTAEFLAENIGQIWRRDDDFIVQFTPSDRDVDIGRRAADIGIRNRRPTGAHLAGLKLSKVAFAAYMPTAGLAAAAQAPWVIVDDGGHLTPSAQYVAGNWGDQDIVRTSNAHNALSLAKAGPGKIVLPTFIGDRIAAMTRIGGPIDALEHTQWMVLHHDGRHVGSVRTVKERLSKLFAKARSGHRPRGARRAADDLAMASCHVPAGTPR